MVSIYDLVGNRNHIQMNNIFKKDLRILGKHTKRKKERKKRQPSEKDSIQ